jgi:hypothetical protein
MLPHTTEAGGQLTTPVGTTLDMSTGPPPAAQVKKVPSTLTCKVVFVHRLGKQASVGFSASMLPPSPTSKQLEAGPKVSPRLEAGVWEVSPQKERLSVKGQKSVSGCEPPSVGVVKC